MKYAMSWLAGVLLGFLPGLWMFHAAPADPVASTGAGPTATPPQNAPPESAMANPTTPSPATPREPAPELSQPEDLRRFDELYAHLYGDPIPWDSDTARDAMLAEITSQGDALEAAGVGHVEVVDCDSYPCVGMLVAKGSISDAMGAMREHMPGVQGFSWFPVTVDGESMQTVVFEQTVHDVERYDVTLQGRKADLMIDAEVFGLDRDLGDPSEPFVWSD